MLLHISALRLSLCAITFTQWIFLPSIQAFSLPASPALRPEQLDAINTFTSEVDAILKSNDPQSEFISFKLNGPKAPRKAKKMSDDKIAQVEKEKEELRGKIREVQGRLILLQKKGKKAANAADESLLVQTTVKYHGATDVAKNCNLDDVEKCLQELFAPGSSSSGGISTSEWGEVDTSESPIQTAEFQTVGGTWKLDLTQNSSKKLCTFIKNKGSKSKEPTKPLSHDQPKNVLLSPSAPFFQKLGITDSDGKPKIARSSKLRQCQKFVEIVSRLVDDSLLPSTTTALRIVDMGCGRGYLTFALHSHLYDKYDKLDVQSRGVDVRPKLMNEVNSIARDLGNEFDGLKFMTGTIESAEINDDIDVLIALHACDTATDDSLWYGMKKNANIIVSAPCCHKQVRSYLDAHVAKAGDDHPYADVLRHNIYKERIAETVTDSMRALLLEIADYDVQVFEFIGGEHTSKNVMITAVKRAKERSESQKEQLRSRLKSLADLHGVKRQKLADLMDEPIAREDEEASGKKAGRRGMPSL